MVCAWRASDMAPADCRGHTVYRAHHVTESLADAVDGVELLLILGDGGVQSVNLSLGVAHLLICDRLQVIHGAGDLVENVGVLLRGAVVFLRNGEVILRGL